MRLLIQNLFVVTAVEFGTTVTVENEGRNRTWTIVGNGEADVEKGTMSWRSPLARQSGQKKLVTLSS